MMKWIDMPPVWLAGFLLVAWRQSVSLPLLSLEGWFTQLLSGMLIGAAILLFAFAVVQFQKHKTTIIPGQEASAMIQSGIYRFSRNPIYLADALLLAGLILRWDAVLSLPLIPIFVWIIEKRFIEREEDHLRKKFRVQYAAYCRKTRRWL